MQHPSEYLKAVLGFAIPFAGAILLALSTGEDGVTSTEWLGAAATAIVTGGAVWVAPNAPRRVEEKEPPL